MRIDPNLRAKAIRCAAVTPARAIEDERPVPGRNRTGAPAARAPLRTRVAATTFDLLDSCSLSLKALGKLSGASGAEMTGLAWCRDDGVRRRAQTFDTSTVVRLRSPLSTVPNEILCRRFHQVRHHGFDHGT